MNNKRMIYRPDDYPLSFEWSGGAYIDIYSMDDARPDKRDRTGRFEMQHAAQRGAPFEVINVWDYATDQPTVPRTHEGLKSACDEWLADPDNRESYGL